MPTVDQFIDRIDGPTLIVAVLLVFAVIVVIRIGKALLLAGIFGALAGGASLGQGIAPGEAATHGAIGFGVAAATLFLLRFTRSLILWPLITALGLGALLVFGVGR